ncbi:MAG TPA: helix-turn-helix transcriptional regulator [Micromonospora sp.]
MAESGSTVQRRQLGRYLKQAREKAGISLEAAAAELEWSRAKMYRIEGGQNVVRTHDVIAMCNVYGVSAEQTQALIALAKESKSRGWWHAYGDVIPSWFELYVGMEAVASRLRHYEPTVVPGLLQTREYAAVVTRTAPDMSETQVDQAVALRLERQKILTRRRPRPPKLEVILDEMVLRRPILDAEGWRDQLQHLITAMESGMSVRIIPSDRWPHRASVAGAFVILDFPSMGTRPAEPTTVYSEDLTGAHYLDRPKEIRAYAEAWAAMCRLALTEAESHELVTAMMKESLDA